MTRLRALTSSFRHQMLHFFAEPQWLIPNIIAPFVMTLVALMLFRNSSGDFILYAILGGGMMGMWGNTLYSSGYSIQFDRWNGTLEAVLATPAPLVWIIAGRSLWNATIGILNAVFIFAIAVFWFQVPLTLADPPLFFLALFVTLMSLASLGLVFSSAFVLTRNAGVLTNGLEFPIYVGTGTMFPIAMLPAWSGPLSLSLAPSWGIDAMRYSAINGYSGLSLGYWGDMAIMVVLAVVYVTIAFVLFQKVERRVRVKGDMGRIRMFARFSDAVRVFWSSAVLAKNALFNWLSPPMWIMQLFTISLFQIAFFVYVTKYVQNPDISVTYVAIGNALQSIAYVTVFAVCNITGEEKQAGTLVPILSTPANRMAMFVGRAMFQIVNGIATAVIALFYAAFLFGVDFSHTDMLALGVVIVVTAFAMTGFGLMLSSIGLYLRTSMIIANIFLFIGLLFCGVNFPVSYLPVYLQPISYGIPMTFGTDAARAAVDGTSLIGISGTLGLELFVGLAAIFFGYLMFTLFENLSRKRGTMDRY